MRRFCYRRLPGIVARTMSSDTEPIPVFSAFCCLGLRASLLPFRFAMTASFLTAPRTAARQLAARLIHDVKGMSLARRPRLHEPGLGAVFGMLPERKPHFGRSNHRRILARLQVMSNCLCSKLPLAGRHKVASQRRLRTAISAACAWRLSSRFRGLPGTVASAPGAGFLTLISAPDPAPGNLYETCGLILRRRAPHRWSVR